MEWKTRRNGNCATGCLGLIVLAVVIGSFLPDPEGGAAASRSSARPGAPTTTPSPVEVALQRTTLKVNRWWKDGFDIVMMLDVSIANGGTRPIKDLEITCEHFAPSGTKIDSNTHTLYERIAPGATRRFRKVNMGFIVDQAKATRCRVVDFVVE